MHTLPLTAKTYAIAKPITASRPAGTSPALSAPALTVPAPGTRRLVASTQPGAGGLSSGAASLN